jgi:hypothetical protein
MGDIREYISDDQENLRAAIQGELKKIFVAMPVIVDKTSEDGHTVKVKMAIKGIEIDKNGKKKKVEYPTMDMAPIHFAQGGGVTLTHPAAEKDEGIAIFMSRPQDLWHEKGDVQDPVDNRMFALSDARYIPGGRSDPRKIKHVSTTTAHLRSDDGKHTFEQDPKSGMTAKSVHPDDKEDNPWKDGKKYHSVTTKGKDGYVNQSVDKNKKKVHKHSLDYDKGHVIDANNGKHKTEIHPDKGVKSSADDGKHVVELKSGEGVNVNSDKKVTVDAPVTNVKQDMEVGKNLDVKEMLKAAQAQLGQAQIGQALIGAMRGAGGGAVGGNAMGANAGNSGVGSGGLSQNAAANNIGQLGGDLAGVLPNPDVVGCLNIRNAHLLIDAASDSAAAKKGVEVGQLYKNTTSIPGCTLVCVRNS